MENKRKDVCYTPTLPILPHVKTLLEFLSDMLVWSEVSFTEKQAFCYLSPSIWPSMELKSARNLQWTTDFRWWIRSDMRWKGGGGRQRPGEQGSAQISSMIYRTSKGWRETASDQSTGNVSFVYQFLCGCVPLFPCLFHQTMACREITRLKVATCFHADDPWQYPAQVVVRDRQVKQQNSVAKGTPR